MQMLNSNNIENFVFKVTNDDDYSDDLEFQLCIGEKSIETWLSGWSNDMSQIREKLETYIREGHIDLDIDFDTEITRICLTKENDNVHISVRPYYIDDEKFETISGLCNEKDVLGKLYYGFLYGSTFRYDDYGWGYNWYDCKMVNYNMMKSQTIEHYLKTGEYKQIEHFLVRHILIYDGKDITHLCDESFGYHVPITERMEIQDNSGTVLTVIDGNKIKSNNYTGIVDQLPNDLDMWTVSIDEKGFIKPVLIERINEVQNGEIFDATEPEIKERGSDPYGFTCETIRVACDTLDFDKIKYYLSHGADHRYVLDWIINSNEGGTEDSAGNATYEESEESLRNRDCKKSDIIRYIITTYTGFEIKESHLMKCCWNYCPTTMTTLLEFGANPNEGELSDPRVYSVLYRSALNIVNMSIERNEDKFGMLLEMKNVLIEYGAVDKVITKDDLNKES